MSLLMLLFVVLAPLQQEKQGEHEFFLNQQKASQLLNDSTIADISRGIDLVRSGNIEEARRLLCSLLRAHHANDVLQYDLGVVYKFAGNYARSKRHLLKAIRLNPQQLYRDQLREVKQLIRTKQRIKHKE